MKRFLFTMLVVSLLCSPGFAEVISIRADQWCPYNCKPGADKPGYMIEIAQVVFKKAGHTVDYQELNWSRAILETREGKHAAIVGAAKGDAPDFMFPDEPLGVMQNVFWAKKGTTWRFQGVESLQQVRLGVIQDYDYGEIINAYVEEHQKNTLQVQIVSGTDGLEINIRKLERGRINVTLEDQNVFAMKASELGKLELFENIGPGGEQSVEENFVYLAFSPANPKSKEYAQILSEGIKAIRASGDLQRILARYGLKDWK